MPFNPFADRPRWTRDPLLLTAGLVQLLFLVYIATLLHTRGPYMDDWNVLYFTRDLAEGKATWSELFEKFYGNHITAFAKLLFSLDYIFFNGSNIFPSLFALVCLLCSFTIILRHLEKLVLNDAEYRLLALLGFALVFSAAHIYLVYYPWGCFQHVPALWLSFILFDRFARDRAISAHMTIGQASLYFCIGAMASFFTAAGLFSLIAIPGVLILKKHPVNLPLLFFCCLLAILLYCYRPTDILINLDQHIYTRQDLPILRHLSTLEKISSGFIFFTGFLGSLIISLSYPLGLALGVLILLFLPWLGHKIYQRPALPIFFLTFSVFILSLSFVTTVARAETHEELYDRFYAIYSWLLWLVCILAVVVFPRFGRYATAVVLAVAILMNYFHIQNNLDKTRDITRAHVNLINGSMIHMVYHIMSLPLRIINFDPTPMTGYLREKQWGALKQPDYQLALTALGPDKCEAIKTKQFVVSEKQFVEYQLDAWNETSNHDLPVVYAVDDQNHRVGYGVSMPRTTAWLPTAWLPREKVMVYLVMPRSYSLSAVRLIGGEDNHWCEIALQK